MSDQFIIGEGKYKISVTARDIVNILFDIQHREEELKKDREAVDRMIRMIERAYHGLPIKEIPTDLS